ncbi:MAG: MBL fold metallo-hydrolase [Bacteroidota bacterium]|nr:MBL fold metallo-hydrolase [Candidatus Kapabacteria bacterium]MDW8221185.1 MBL fold metallo-hydrolase [Bacteroidota bacterium]
MNRSRNVEPLADPRYQSRRTISVYQPKPSLWRNDTVTVAWIGHATVLINFFGVIILTDPVLFERVGVYLFGVTFGLTRLVPPALSFDKLPQPDVIVLSHVHMDHCDMQTLTQLTQKYPREIVGITAKHTSDVVSDLSWRMLKEIDWNERFQIATLHGDIEIQGLEVRHFGWRLPGELDRASGHHLGRSFNAYILERYGKRIVFGGDTAMTDSFRRAFEHDTHPVDIAIMPIGAYNPWRTVHCTPEEALRMAQDMHARYIVPIHCMTFPLGREALFEPMERLHRAAEASNVTIALSAIGKTFELPL